MLDVPSMEGLALRRGGNTTCDCSTQLFKGGSIGEKRLIDGELSVAVEDVEKPLLVDDLHAHVLNVGELDYSGRSGEAELGRRDFCCSEFDPPRRKEAYEKRGDSNGHESC